LRKEYNGPVLGVLKKEFSEVLYFPCSLALYMHVTPFFSCVVVVLWADPCTYGRSFKKAIGKVYLE
jgi:hypothetical protein